MVKYSDHQYQGAAKRLLTSLEMISIKNLKNMPLYIGKQLLNTKLKQFNS